MTVRIAFVGTGGIARQHLTHLQAMEDVALVGLYDVDPEACRKAGTVTGAPCFASVEELLDRAAPDALYVCVPPFAHGTVEEEAAARGIHLFVEKPVALSEEEARRKEAAISRAGVVAAVGYHWRYMDTVQAAREALAGRTVGMAVGRWHGSMPGVWWWRVQARSGGQLVEQTTHIVDLCRYLLGEVVEVYGMFAKRHLPYTVPECDVDDVGSVQLRLASGAIATVTQTCLIDAGFQAGLEVMAPGVTVECWSNEVRLHYPDRTVLQRARVNPYAEEDRAFVAAVRNGDPSQVRSPYQDAVRTLKVTLAAHRSAREGRPVPVD